MREETIKIFTFEELSDNAKKTAMEWYINGMDYFIGPQYDEFYLDDLKDNGFNIEPEQFNFSLNNCQGDGVSFDCADFNEELLFKNFLKDFSWDREYKIYSSIKDNVDITMQIIKNSYATHYCHERTRYFECHLNTYNAFSEYPLIIRKIESMLEDFEDYVEELRKDLCLKYEKMLYLEIEHQQSEESISEMMIANEYEFYEDGAKY